MLLKAGAAKDRAALRGLERNRGLRAALRTGRSGLRTHARRSASTFRLALLAVLGIIFKLFIVEENLLARRKDKLGAAIAAL